MWFEEVWPGGTKDTIMEMKWPKSEDDEEDAETFDDAFETEVGRRAEIARD